MLRRLFTRGQDAEAPELGAPGSSSAPAQKSTHSKFLIEPLEPRVLLSADPISAALYRSLQEDEVADTQPEFDIVSEQLDAATSAEIAVTGGANFGDAQSASKPAVAWTGSWQAASAADANAASDSSAVDGTAAGIPDAVSEATHDDTNVVLDASALAPTPTENSDASDKSSSVSARTDDPFSSVTLGSQSARGPPGHDAVASATLAEDSLSINEVQKTDSLNESEGGSSAVQLLVISSASDANLARAPPANETLSEEILAPILHEAMRLWTSSGIAERSIARLANLNVQIADLPNGELGEANGYTIALDDNAAGRGWFADPTPADGSEFSATLTDSRSAASADSAAFGRVDLLTVVLHEIGHVLGFDHDSGLTVMNADVAPGERIALAGTATPASAEPVAGAATLANSGTAAAAQFNMPTASSNAVTLAAGAAGNLKLTSENGTFDPTEFAVPTTSLTIKLGSAGDTLTINALDPAFTTQSLTVNGFGTAADNITLNAKTGTGPYALNGGAGNDRFTIGQMTASALTIDGGADTDVLISSPGAAVTLTDTSFVAGQPALINATLSSIEIAAISAPTVTATGFTGVVSAQTNDAAWTPVGPFSTTDGQVEGMDPQGNPIAGAVNVVAVDQNNKSIAYLASPNGGIWKTTNFLATTSVTNPQGGTVTVPAVTWTPLTDQNQSLSISALVIDPANSNILYAGTGNTSSGHDSGTLTGLLKSTDAGATWSAIGGETFKDLRVNSILVFHGALSEKLLVGTSKGLYTVGTSGESPTKMTEAVNGLPGGALTDLIRETAASNTVFAAIPGLGIFKSTNRGINWTPALALPLSERIKLAVGTDGTLYVAELGTYVKLAADAAAAQNQLTLNSVANLAPGTATDPTKVVMGAYSNVATAAAIGDATLVVADGSTFGAFVGDVTIGRGAESEVVHYSSVSGNTLTLDAALTKTHRVFDPVILITGSNTVTAVNAATKVATVATNLALGQPTGAAVAFGQTRLVGLYKLASGGASFTPVALPTTTENGLVYGLQGYQGDLHFSMTVDPVSSNVVYLGGAIQPTVKTSTYELAVAVASPFGNTIKVGNVADLAVNNTLVIDRGGASQESAQVSAITEGPSAEIFVSAPAGQNTVQVFSAAGFSANDNIVLAGGAAGSQYAKVQSTTDRSGTATTLAANVAAGNSTLTLASVATYARGDRVVVFQGDKLDTVTVTGVDVPNKRVFVTTGDLNAPAVGLKNAYTTGADVRVLSSIAVDANLTAAFGVGSTISKFSTITLNAPLTLAHAQGTKITVTRTVAGNTDYSGRLFMVDSATPANTQSIAGYGASGGGWNGKLPSAPHGDSRSMTVVIVPITNIKYLIETDDGGVFRLALTNGASDLSAANRKWQSMNGNLTTEVPGPNALALSEVGSVVYDPINDVYQIGTQDAGSQQQSASDALQWKGLTGGDGNTQAVALEPVGGTTAARIKEVLAADPTSSALFTIDFPREAGQFNSGAGAFPSGVNATLSGGVDVVQASALAILSGSNNDLQFTVKLNATIGGTQLLGPAGNGIAIQFKNSGSSNPANNSVVWDSATKIITITIAPNTIATDVQALVNASAAAPIVSVGLSPLDSGKLNTGAGKLASSDLGKVSTITANGKGAAASATFTVPGSNNDVRISAKTLGTAMNGVTVTFGDGAASTGPGSETVGYVAGSKTLTFQIAPDPTGQLTVWRYFLGNNFLSLQRSQYNDANENITPAASGSQRVALTGIDAKEPTTGFWHIPYVVNSVDPTRILIGFYGLYESKDRGDTVTKIVAPTASQAALPNFAAVNGAGLSDFTVSAVAYGGKNANGTPNPDVLYFARADVVYVRTGKTAYYDREARPGGVITDIVMDPNNWQIAYITTETQVFATVDGGQNWTDITGKLAAAGQNVGLSTIEIIKGNGGTPTDALLVGGTLGVFRTLNPVGTPGGTATPNVNSGWDEFGAGLPNAIVSDLHYTPAMTYNGEAKGDILTVGTKGRGVFEIGNAAAKAATSNSLTITGSSGKISALELRQDASNPALMEVFVDGVATGVKYQVATLDNITIQNRGRADAVLIDGRLRVGDQIDVVGGATNIASLTVDAKSTAQPTSTVFGSGGTVTLATGTSKLVVSYNKVTNVTVTNPATAGAALASGASALGSVKVRVDDKPVGPVSATGILTGQQEKPGALSDPDASTGAAAEELIKGESLSQEIFRRLLEAEDGSFTLEDFANYDISIQAQRDELIQKLDDLDDVPGNVTYSAVDNQFDIRVERDLEGMTDLDFEALGGSLGLKGTIELEAEVKLHIVMGVDANGFYILPGSQAEPTLIVDDIHVVGEIEAGGDFGIVQAEATNPVLTINPAVQLILVLNGPQPPPSGWDGKVRLGDFDNDPLSMFDIDLVGGGAGDDLVFDFDVEISSIFGSLPTQSFELTWADISNPLSISVSGPGVAYIKGLIDDLTAVLMDGLDALDDLADQLASADFLNVNLPLVNQPLSSVIDVSALLHVGHAVADYLADPGDPTHSDPQYHFPTFAGLVQVFADELNSALASALPDTPITITGGLYPDTGELRFDFHLDLSKTISPDLDLGPITQTLGLDSASVEIDFTVGVELDFSIGIDLSDLVDGNAANFGADDAFLELHKAEATGLANLDFSASVSGDLGFATGALSIDDANVLLDASVNLGISDPDGDGKLRFNELGDIGSLLQLEPHATVEATLPVTGTLTGSGFELGGTFTFALLPYDVFSGASPQFDISLSGFLEIGDVVAISGDFAISFANGDLMRNDGHAYTGVDYTLISGANIDVFVGSGPESDPDAFGVSLHDVEFSLLLFTDAGTSTSYTALNTYGGSASVIGVPGLVLQAWSLGVELNQTSDTAHPDLVLDFASGGSVAGIEITPSIGPAIAFEGEDGSVTRVTGTAVIDAFDSVIIKGSFSVQLGTVTDLGADKAVGGTDVDEDTVYNAMVLQLGSSAFDGAEAVQVFIGIGGALDDVNGDDGAPDRNFSDDLINTDSAIGLYASLESMTLATLKNAGSPTDTTDDKSYMGLELTGLDAKLVGIPGLTFGVYDGAVKVNKSSDTDPATNTPPPKLDCGIL